MILKFQKPLYWSPGESPNILIYNKYRTFETLIPYDSKDNLFGNRLKFYAKCVVTKNEIEIKEIIADQDW